MMKKLTIKALKEMLDKESFFLGGYKGVIKDKNNYFVVYPFTMVKLSYSPVYQWAVTYYGEVLYGIAKHYLKLCDRLEELGYLGDENND